MKKLFPILCLLCCLTTTLKAQSILKQNNTLHSRILNQDISYSLYLPDGYDRNDRSYPVLYLLHGMGDDYRAWSQQGNLQTITDKAIAEEAALPMIIVMPDGGQSWYVNRYDGKQAYEDMFFRELIPHIDSTLRTRPEKEFRAIAGLSMGGYGSLLYALKHPEHFAACCPLSAAVFTDEQIRQKAFFANLFHSLYGSELPNAYWQQNSILNLIQQMPDNQKSAVRFYIDCGDDDFLYAGNSALHMAMRDRGIPHEYRVRDGGHSWSYWRSGLPAILEFISQSFRRS